MIKNYLKKLALAFLIITSGIANAQVPTPKSLFGFNIGDNYKLANYTQTEAYFKKIAATSNRVKLVDIGKTEEGRSQYMMIVSSPENIKNLNRYKEISQKLAQAEITPVEAKKLAQEGKAVVWIDGGLHATETVGAHQLIQTIYDFTSRTDAETMRILDNVIILFTHANPDGQELVSNWYMREKDSLKRSTANLPKLYEKYAGHDNNRDFYMMNLKETQNITNQLFLEWLPQIMYNHHQSGPAGTIVAGPPYRDPFNYVFDPTVLTSLDAVGAAMHNRMNNENKPGYTQRGGSVFSTWYNGGLRTVTYFHNMIGLLTEIVGGPTPSEIPLVPSRLLPNGDSPNPVTPRKWYFKNAIDYSVSLNYAVLSYAQRYRDEVLYNIYHMGRNSIERGRKDTWSFSPKKIDAINAALKNDKNDTTGNEDADTKKQPNVKYFDAVMKAPENRDPRGYIISANQPDFNTAIKFLNALIKTGVVVQKATANFSVSGKNYPAGSYIVKTDQAFRPHVLDMFEPQDHPNDFKYAGGPPIPPYDAAGWTLAYLMVVKFDRLMDDFNGPFVRNPYGKLLKPENKLPEAKEYVLSAMQNDSFVAVNDLLKNKEQVYRDTENGDFYVAASVSVKAILEKANVKLTAGKAANNKIKINPSRIALWDVYGGSMPSGWVRWILEKYHYEATIVYANEIDAGDLKSKYDVIVFVGGAIPALKASSSKSAPKEENTPNEYKNQLGKITAEKSIPQLKKFLEEGGNIVTVGSSTNLAYQLGLPVKNAIVETVNKVDKKLPNEKYYIPGSVLNVEVDNKQPATYGMESEADIYFDNSPVFKFTADDKNIKPLMWFNSATSLRSGWALGQSYLKDGITAFEASIGKGKLFAFGPEILFRAQTHGTFKLLFNQLYK